MRNVTRAYGIRAENYPFQFGDSLSRPKVKLLAERNTVRHLRTMPARSGNKGSESKGIGVVIFLMIAIVFILLLSAR